MTLLNNNPFSISFGEKPYQYISRPSQTNQIIDIFNSEHPSTHTIMITGVRGSGKTVMMTEIENKLVEQGNWLSFDLLPDRDLLKELASKLYSVSGISTFLKNAKIDLSLLGLGVTVTSGTPISDEETAIETMTRRIMSQNKKILITIDEVTNNSSLRSFAGEYQILLRKGIPVFMIMAGLYENISEIQNDKVLTFLYRVPRIEPTPLNMGAVSEKYKSIFEIEQSNAMQLARLTKGYSFAFQVLGYVCWELNSTDIDQILSTYDHYLADYVYEKLWSEQSANDQTF